MFRQTCNSRVPPSPPGNRGTAQRPKWRQVCERRERLRATRTERQPNDCRNCTMLRNQPLGGAVRQPSRFVCCSLLPTAYSLLSVKLQLPLSIVPSAFSGGVRSRRSQPLASFASFAANADKRFTQGSPRAHRCAAVEDAGCHSVALSGGSTLPRHRAGGPPAPLFRRGEG